MPDELLTVNEVAELLKLNPQTIRNMIDRANWDMCASAKEARPGAPIARRPVENAVHHLVLVARVGLEPTTHGL